MFQSNSLYFQLPGSSSFNGELLMGGGGESSVQTRLPGRSSSSLSPADYLERAEVPSRRESSTPLPMKTEVPIHLISTTNQHHKQGVVQQQIPTKLAIMKSKDKSGKGKASHRTDSSASVIHLKHSGRDGENTLKARRSVSPHTQPPQTVLTDPASLADSCLNEPPSNQTASQNLTPPYALPDETSKEHVIYF
ncbi:hypothetical protein NFI96_023027 [Prochilodus magdalenae]|nr:hypothetical protein NFI96_023027 [Prochilodus magdalenae]